MATLIFPIQSDGLICDVLIGLDGLATAALAVAGQPILAPILCRGLIDTGSDITCVNSAVLRRLGLNKPSVQATTQTVRGSAHVDFICQDIVKKLKGSSQKVRGGQILLKADADGPGWSDVKIAEAFDCRVRTVENLRERLVTEGFELAPEGKKRQEPRTPPKLDGVAEAKLIAMRLGKPPAGYGHWTLQLLADELVALEVVDSISHETVRKTLKKTV